MFNISKKFRIVICLSITFIFCWTIWKAFLQDIVPRKRTLFLSYDSFVDKASNIKNTYPDELPSSAENIRYFHYRGGFDTKTGISFTVSQDEYQKLKQTYLSVYLSEEEEYSEGNSAGDARHQMEGTDRRAENRNRFVFDERVTQEVLAEEELDYLGEIFHSEIDDYTFLAYEKVPTIGDGYYLDGVLCNDDLSEMVFFAFKDGVRKE